MTERSPGVWRLQTTSDPDAVTGKSRRLSRTFRGSKPEATAELQRFVAESGAGLQGGSTVTVATLLESFMSTATLSPTTRQDWASLIDRYLVAELGDIPLWKLTARDCDQMYQRLRLGGLGPSRVRNAHVILHRAVRSLTSLHADAELTAIEAGRTMSTDDLIFSRNSEATEPWRPELVTRRWERLRKRTGLEHVKLHGLRHFVATELLTAGIDLRTVSNRLGHARTSTTLDIYWAWVPAQDEAAAAHLDNVLCPAASPSPELLNDLQTENEV